MKYLVIYRANPALNASVPPPAMMEMVEAAASWLDEQKKAGQIEAAYFFGADHGGTMIVDVSRGSDLLSLIDAVPTRPFCDVETIPLLAIEEWREYWPKAKARMLEMFAKMAKPAK